MLLTVHGLAPPPFPFLCLSFPFHLSVCLPSCLPSCTPRSEVSKLTWLVLQLPSSGCFPLSSTEDAPNHIVRHSHNSRETPCYCLQGTRREHLSKLQETVLSFIPGYFCFPASLHPPLRESLLMSVLGGNSRRRPCPPPLSARTHRSHPSVVPAVLGADSQMLFKIPPDGRPLPLNGNSAFKGNYFFKRRRRTTTGLDGCTPTLSRV